MNIKVKCINIRETMPSQIIVGETYFIKDIWDDKEDWYGEIYTEGGERIGSLKLSHFTRTE